MAGHRMLEHTADIAVEIWAEDLPGLFSQAARALLEIMLEEGEVRPARTRHVEVKGVDLPDVLVGWLSELLLLLESEGLVFSGYQVEQVDEHRLSATVQGERLDPERHGLGREVKAITYHTLELEQQEDGTWRAHVVFDL
ncbi:MAG: archease [Armatimonadetes bacterium]|nr:archease [Armatimonadota bacterium]